jgi:hypothetical protein
MRPREDERCKKYTTDADKVRLDCVDNCEKQHPYAAAMPIELHKTMALSEKRFEMRTV